VLETKRAFWTIGQSSPPRKGVALAFGDDEANARLIAAAPDLLEALEEIEHWRADAGVCHFPDDVMIAALTKARGTEAARG
jgi:hypothetical protein